MNAQGLPLADAQDGYVRVIRVSPACSEWEWNPYKSSPEVRALISVSSETSSKIDLLEGAIVLRRWQWRWVFKRGC
jgi:hypothetical protein